MNWHVGVDIGGTFTDAVAVCDGRAWSAKASTTPDDLTHGVLGACHLVADAAGRSLEDILSRSIRFGLGTTAVTNMLASRTGKQLGLLTTAGFEDLLPLARGRLVADEGWLTSPEQLVPRSRIIGINERIDRRGVVLRPLSVEEVVQAGSKLVGMGCEAIVVSFLWSFVNPENELVAVESLAEQFPDVPVVAGSSVHSVIREFERTMVALLNAYAGDAIVGVDHLVGELAELGLRVPVILVHSGGGAIGLAEARRVPIGLVESGPAAGVSAAAAIAMKIGANQVVTCDIGGTSVDVAVVDRGQPARRQRGELMGFWTAVSSVDVESIGAGGGSVAWVDTRGMLQVGPRSAGASPGPACYGLEGREPTLTDALLLLGYIDPGGFLGGRMRLNVERAYEACADVGIRLGLDPYEAAWGIREIALTGMARMIRTRLAKRGLDPGTMAIVAYGGGGGLFAAAAAAIVGIPRVIIPELASVLSAIGAATIGVRRERVRSVGRSLPVEPAVLDQIVAELADLVASDLEVDGIPASEQSVKLEADLRFKRQTNELTVAFGDDLLGAFETEYIDVYGQGALARKAPVELVTLRAVGLGASLAGPETAGTLAGPPSRTLTSSRKVRLDRNEAVGPDVRVWDLRQWPTGVVAQGPWLLDGKDTTVWVPAGASAHRDADGTVLIEVSDA
jgi:N-methylhydantoinase A